MNNWKSKLSSRKLWAAIVAVLVVILTIFVGEDLTPELTSALECIVFAAVAYIFGEGAVDIARVIADAIKKAYAVAKETMDTDEENGESGDNNENTI